MHERQGHLPSPVKQRILWSSPLKGMERPARSFKSFIRTVPPNPSQNLAKHKPLPPTPSTPGSPTSISSPLSPALTSSERTTSVTPWKAPAEWQWDHRGLSTRNYSPLLPEPTPRSFEMQDDSGPWPLEASEPQQPRLQPIQEGPNDRPDPPHRTPSRAFPLLTPSAESGPGVPLSPMDHGLQSPPLGVETPASGPEAISGLQLQTTLPPSSELTYRVSDASTKAKAFASLGIGSPRDTRMEWEDWVNDPNPLQAEHEVPVNLTLRGKKLRPLNRGSPILDDKLESADLSNKLQQLSFSQDYHNALTDQYHKMSSQPQKQQASITFRTNSVGAAELVPPNVPSKDHELVPHPLTWRKEPNTSSASSSAPNLQTRATSSSKPKMQYKRIASWVALHHHNNAQERHSTNDHVYPRSASDPVVLRRQQSSGLGVDRFLRKDIRIPNLLAHTKGLMPHKARTKAAEARHTTGKPPRPRPRPLASSSPRMEQSTPLIRLPGGFALVRQSPSNIPPSQSASPHDVSPLAETPRRESYTGSVVSTSTSSQQRSSIYSQQSQAPVAPGVAVHKRLRNSVGSSPSPYFRSNTSSPSTSPLAHEIPLPRTPPPRPPQPPHVLNTHPISSPLSYESEDRLHAKNNESDEEHDGHVHKILDKARGARDAWRKHQREVKHERLKQSIRVLGPTDPAVTAGYVKREGRRPGDDDVESERIPGYMVTGPV